MRVEQKVSVAIGAACAIVLAVALAAAGGMRRLVAAADWVGHTHDVRAQLQAISRHTNAAKADLRDYLLTRDSAFLRQHVANISAAEAAFAAVQRLTADNPPQEDRLAALRRLLDEREVSFARTVAIGPASVPIMGALAAQLQIGESLSHRIDSVSVAADNAEAALLVERMRRERSSELLVAAMSIALVLGVISLTLLLWRSINRDLSGRARAEAALRASEAKFSGILDVAADAIISIDGRGTIVHFNRGAQAIFGYTAEEAIGRSLSVLLPARHREAHEGHVTAFAAGPQAARRMGERRQLQGLRKNGEEFDAEASISKLETAAGPLLTAVLRDVTERNRREGREHAVAAASGDLARSLDYETTLRSVASLPVPAIGAWSILDIAEECDDGERRLRRLVSHHPNPAVESLLRALEECVPDWDSPEPFVDVFRTGEALVVDRVSRDWLEAHCLDARRVELVEHLGMRSLLVVPLTYRDRTIGVWTVGSSAEHLFDSFDRALAAALAERATMAMENARLLLRAQHAAEARDRVMSMVSHDLRNPLAAITMLARQLADDRVPEDKQREIGAHILASTDWMGGLMQDLLDVASIEAGRFSIEPEPQIVGDLVEVALADFHDRASQRGVMLESTVSANLSFVLADGHRVQQVLGNLVGNALKFTGDGGRITVSASQDDREVTIRVRDTGAGIPAADLPHVFDRFWHSRRGAATRGNGLGLAIVDGIVRAHGGRAWVESVVGDGSTFSFTLPVHRVHAGVAPSGVMPSTSPLARA
jgi:PAS domain S-box-containing protein